MIDNKHFFGNCAICGGALSKVLLTITEPDRFERHLGVKRSGYLRRWVECASCGVSTNILPEGVLEQLEIISSGYYEVDFKSSTIRQKYDAVMEMVESKSDNAQRVRRVHAFLLEWNARLSGCNRKVLDIGAGTGVFLSRFLSEGAQYGQTWSAVAVEPDSIAADHLRSIGEFEVRNQTFTEALALKDFDLCTLNKVLEQLPEPMKLLRSIATALNPSSGVFYCEVPAKQTIAYRPSTDNILGSLHRHLYDVESLNKALTLAGFVVLEILRLFEPSGKITIDAFAVRPDAANIRYKSIAHA